MSVTKGIDHNEDWNNLWQLNQIPWHKDNINKNLVNNLNALINGKPNQRILVPLCGKTLDMIWLIKEGYSVIGVEVARKGIEDFFSENDIPYEKEQIEGVLVYKAFDGRLKIYECDYYHFNSSIAGGKVDCVWDCNALGAVSPGKRKQYLKTSLELLEDFSHAGILLQAYHYDTEGPFEGPPHSVSVEDLRGLLGDSFELQVLSEYDDPKPRKVVECSLLPDKPEAPSYYCE